MGEFDYEDMKKTINNFLWCNLPPSCSIQEAEDIAIDILKIMEKSWDKHIDRNSKKVAARD